MSRATSYCRPLALAALCGLALAGCGLVPQEPDAHVVSSAGASTPAGGAATPHSTASAVAAASHRCADLLDCLMPAPKGSTPWSSKYGPDGVISPKAFVAAAYDSAAVRTQELARLSAEGNTSIARRRWVAPDDVQGALTLLRFSSVDGATSRYLGVVSGGRDDGTRKPVTLQGVAGDVATFYDPTLDSEGNVLSVTYARVGAIEMEFFTFSPSRFDRATTTAWVKQELARLDG